MGECLLKAQRNRKTQETMDQEICPSVTKEELRDTLKANIMQLPPLPDEPLVSVLVINYNYSQYLPEALESLLGQTYTKWQAILVDDGSKDNSREIMSNFSKRDTRFKCVFKENGGVPSALNAAYAHADGDIIALLDSDDAFLPSKIEWCVKAFQKNSDCGFAGHFVRMVDKTSKPIKGPPQRLISGWLVPEALSDGGRAPLPVAGGLVFRNDVARILFPIPLSYQRGADAYLACLALLFTPFACSDQELALYRQHGSNITSIQSRRWPNRVLMTRLIEDLKRTEQSQLQYMREHLNIDASGVWSIEDCFGYKVSVICTHVLLGRYPENVTVNIDRILTNLPSRGLHLILTFLAKSPRILTVPFVYAWLGEYPGKNLLYPLVKLFRLRRELAISDVPPP